MHVVFGAYELDADKRELRRAGEVVPLEPKAFNVLAHLLTHRHRAVSKSELLETLWPEEYVSEAALARSVRLIRQAVGDAGHQQRVIKTLRGYGYRFIADVIIPAADAAPPVGESTPEVLDALMSPSRDAEPLPDIPPETSVSPAPVHLLAESERRPLTVLVCDLVQASHLAEQLDPEDLQHVLRAYHSTCEQVLMLYEGYLAQRLGSRLVVYFGYPQAQEDAAQRAVLTGLGLLDALSALNLEVVQQQAVTLSIRVGIDSGLVVVDTGEDERAAPMAIGSPQSRAVQLQEVAAPQSVVISSDTLHLVQGWFRCDALSPHVFQGADTPVPIYQAIGRSGVQHRLEVVTPGGLTPLVGREQEVMLLSERWQRVCEGQGQVVVLSGEAGIGKSRLVHVLKEQVAYEPHFRWECRSSPYFTNSALYPVIDLMQRTLQWQPDDRPERKLDQLEHHLSLYGFPLEETVPLFGALLSLPVPENRYAPLTWSPQRQRQKTLETLVAMLLALAENQPVLFILEDLHWTDPTTLEWLELLIDQTPMASICVLLTCRPEFQPSWGHRSYLTDMMLNRLSQPQVARMAEQVAGGKGLPSDIVQQLVDQTDGVPLYVEEMTKSVLESGVLQASEGHYELTGPLDSFNVPETLQDSLMARLDRLVTAKAVAQHASVIGRHFSYALLQAVTQLNDSVLQHELKRLVATELIYQRGLPPQTTYIFTHALVQETAYHSLLRRTRQAYHRRIAEVIEERFPEIVENQPELVAYHYAEAGMNAQAIGYWQQAGETARARSANQEAIFHLSQALELLKALPSSSALNRQELALQLSLALAFHASEGQASENVERAYLRAKELCELLDDMQQLFHVLIGL